MKWNAGNNIILIGMPGVGKSTSGVVLAKIMGYRFMDADLAIQEEEGRLLKDIIAQDGIDEFIAIEDRVNSNITAERTVIATGGSAVYGKNAMEKYKNTATIVYLRLDYETLKDRLGDIEGRGVVVRENQTLRDIYEERSVLYEKYADVTVDETGLGVEKTVEKIMRKLI